MHRWFLLLLIALLPLRGWVGDAAAADMLAQHAVAAQPAAAKPVRMGPAAHDERQLPHHDCVEHAHTPAAMEAAGPSDDVSACAACASCLVCSSVAMAWHSAAAPLPVATVTRPGSSSPRFASADPARELRPPIA